MRGCVPVLVSRSDLQSISIDKLTKENAALRNDVDVAQRDVTHAEQSSGDVKALQAKIEFYQVRTVAVHAALMHPGGNRSRATACCGA